MKKSIVLASLLVGVLGISSMAYAEENSAAQSQVQTKKPATCRTPPITFCGSGHYQTPILVGDPKECNWQRNPQCGSAAYMQ